MSGSRIDPIVWEMDGSSSFEDRAALLKR